jgi:hypothetical protein
MELINIQKLQFSDKQRAEEELLQFLKQNEDPSIVQIDLLPKPESLNSVNGFVTYADNERYFFKSHVEENEQVSEYYNAASLGKAGYPVFTPRQITHKPGKQIAIYEIISLPTLFDLIKSEEDNELQGNPISERCRVLLNAEIDLDKTVAKVYQNTLSQRSAEEHAKVPVNQLFLHRLAEDGRLGLFYRGKNINLKNGPLSFDSMANMRWVINGVEYSDTFNEIIERSRRVLGPKEGPAIVGHGDAHNGNIFVDIEEERLVMFDPAFAGVHNPLLDISKPLFHNVFARWMYYPEQVINEFELSCKIERDLIVIEHSYQPSALRKRFLQSRINNVLKPTLEYLRGRKLLVGEWREYLRSSLFCCPLLTVNLFAPHIPNGSLAEKYQLPIKLLGLSMAMEFGAAFHKGTSQSSDIIDELFV